MSRLIEWVNSSDVGVINGRVTEGGCTYTKYFIYDTVLMCQKPYLDLDFVSVKDAKMVAELIEKGIVANEI